MKQVCSKCGQELPEKGEMVTVKYKIIDTRPYPIDMEVRSFKPWDGKIETMEVLMEDTFLQKGKDTIVLWWDRENISTYP